MAIGKYLSLKEAQKKRQLDRFAKEHPNKGDKKLFGKLLDAMAKTPEADRQESKTRGRSGG